MRFILIPFFLLVTLVSAEEIERIESIVADITKLRNSYVHVKSELKSEKEKNNKYSKKIKSLENEILTLEKEVKIKENTPVIRSSKKQIKSKNQTKQKNCLKNKIKVVSNTFPDLALKSEFKKNNEEVHYFKATTFRVNKLAYIYDTVDGNIVDEWEELRSFTSNQKSDGWIKITGYFVNKVWTPSETILWIESKDANTRTE